MLCSVHRHRAVKDNMCEERNNKTTPNKKRSQYPTASMDLTKFHNTGHTHDAAQGLSRVVMVRKMEQRIFVNSSKTGEEPQVETLTKETVQTFRTGNRTERKITTSQKKNISKQSSDAQEYITLSRSSSSSPEMMSDIKRKSLNKRQPLTDSEVIKFIQECLNSHNEYRSRHKAPLLVLSKKLCKYSEEWAKHLVLKGILEHRQNCPYGENLFCCWSLLATHRVDGHEPVDSWYQEIQYHPFGKEPTSLKSGHFSQVVWVGSRELGVGIAKSRNGHIFVVANYDPPGNFLGQFKENVPPLGGFQNIELPDIKSCNISLFDDEQFLQEGLTLHNEYRKKHRVPRLVLNKDLCKCAEEWAKTLARDDKFMHRPDCSYGENLFSMWSSNSITMKDACTQWYQEGKDYNYNVEPKVLKSGHFTQMVWKNTKEVGFGVSKGRSGRIVIVANYYPAGNVIGQFLDNVLCPRN